MHTLGLANRKTESTGARSTPADPGGRTDGLHGFNSRSEEWSRPPSLPAASGIMAQPLLRRPDVSLVWPANQIAQKRLGPGTKTRKENANALKLPP